ncbi:MAG: hypothetical protein M1838_000413 [Thelocarpon superellum]|nr:MAG: hypothetical protein M1838_000413 [Thelocarpon superellum]
MAPPKEDADRDSASPTPLPTTEGPGNDQVTPKEDTAVTDAEWEAMQNILNTVYNYRDAEGHDPSKVFHRKVNKRVLPEYYDVIKEPMALSTVKANINSRMYKTFNDYVKDFALIPHNAQLYNRPEALAYQDALTVKGLLQTELQKLVEQKTVSAEAAALPDLGEIPPPSPRRADDEGEDDEDDEDEDEDDDADDSDEDGRRKRKRRGPRASTASKREGKGDDESKANEVDARKKRGRPPRVDTPLEARIKAIIKGLRKIKDAEGNMKMNHFERLPDKQTMPEYFVEIKNPVAMDLVKRRAKRKKYQSVDHFMKDMDTMFDNAKMYNQDESQIYKDAVILQRDARHLADQEKKRPDTDYVLEDGRLPLPNGILHNGELWKVGDWVHLQNPNDVTKPIVAQIYRTWQDGDGQKWINACWYYRPEQTVHRSERHFYEHEVVKTGQYRDHHVDEIVDRCFVMFFTRFNKGRPRGFPPDKDVYVCESRYNEEKFKLNKIKTWASCLPDEVREKDYEMDLFEAPKKMKKVPSPIKHLLSDEAKESDELPQPTWGAENAPPVVGAVHKRPREANESPPPEPTPSPPPPPPAAVARPISTPAPTPTNGTYGTDAQGDVNMGGTASQTPAANSRPAPPPTPQIAYDQHQAQQQYPQPAASPAPAPPPQPSYHAPAAPSYAPQPGHGNFAPPPLPAHLSQQYATPHAPSYGYGSSGAGTPRGSHGGAYNPPKAVEVYHLSDNANLSIPADIREQFHRDEHGRVLFFTSPPLDPSVASQPDAAPLGHSVRYLAEKERRRAQLVERERESEKHKRALSQSSTQTHDADTHSTGRKAKAAKTKDTPTDAELDDQISTLSDRALKLLTAQMDKDTRAIWAELAKEGVDGTREMERLAAMQAAEQDRHRRFEAHARLREDQRGTVPLRSKSEGGFLDDTVPLL